MSLEMSASANSLTSDHVNYLIWRYLQETGHGEAAVKLQRDWMVDPQTLPFADNVKAHALISLVHKGLQYHEIERSLKDTRSQLHASATSLFFGAASVRNGASPSRDENGDSDNAASSRRMWRQDRGQGPNGLALDLSTQPPAAKRPRRGPGSTTVNTSTTAPITNGDAMQIDQDGAAPDQTLTATTLTTSPINATANNYPTTDDPAAVNGMDIDEADPDHPSTPTPEPVRTLALGQSTGMQSESSLDLAAQTGIMTLSSPSQTVMHLAWNPQAPTILAAAGESLCRIWQVPRPSTPTDPYHDILPPTDDSLVSTMAWNPSGEVLAIATRNVQSADWVGLVSLWTKQGKAVEDMPAAPEMVIMLRWNLDGTRLLGITSSGERSSSVILRDVSTAQTYAPCQIDGELRDAAWLDDGRFVVCGRGIIGTAYYPSAGAVALDLHRDDTITANTWTHIRHDPSSSSTFCVAEEDGLLIRLSTAHQDSPTVRRSAHAEQITALEVQPTSRSESGRLVATTSLDGTTKIWSSPALNLLNTLTPVSAGPVTSLAFTPDGSFLATANPCRIWIWNPTEQGPPKATWRGELGKTEPTSATGKKSALLANGTLAITGLNDHPAPDRDSAVGDVSEEDGSPSCSLSWDLEGKKLALGVNNQIAIVDFTP